LVEDVVADFLFSLPLFRAQHARRERAQWSAAINHYLVSPYKQFIPLNVNKISVKKFGNINRFLYLCGIKTGKNDRKITQIRIWEQGWADGIGQSAVAGVKIITSSPKKRASQGTGKRKSASNAAQDSL
jgi:hypothetical protein